MPLVDMSCWLKLPICLPTQLCTRARTSFFAVAFSCIFMTRQGMTWEDKPGGDITLDDLVTARGGDNKTWQDKKWLWAMSNTSLQLLSVCTMLHILLSSLSYKLQTIQACTEARERGHFRLPTDFSPLYAFLPSTAHFKSVPKAFFVHCMTHWSLFPCYSCHGMGNGQIGADAHEQAPQSFPWTVEILARAFLPCFPHEVCHQVLWRGKQGEGGDISLYLNRYFVLFHPAITF